MKSKWLKLSVIITISLISLPSYAYAQGDVEQLITHFIIAIFGGLLAFFILREIFCWYWKINEALSVFVEIRDLLKVSKTNSTVTLEENQQVDNKLQNLKIG